MRGYMFKNRWTALAFVCLTAYGAASLIGGEEDEGLLLSATEDLTQSRSEFGERSAELSKTRRRPVLDASPVGEFASDDELMYNFAAEDDLIDDTDGFDPVPDVDPNSEMDSIAVPVDEYMLVDDDEIH